MHSQSGPGEGGGSGTGGSAAQCKPPSVVRRITSSDERTQPWVGETNCRSVSASLPVAGSIAQEAPPSVVRANCNVASCQAQPCC